MSKFLLYLCLSLLLAACSTQDDLEQGRGDLLVCNRGSSTLAHFLHATTAQGSLVPQTYIRGANTHLSQPGQLAYLAQGQHLIVPNGGDQSILFFENVLSAADGLPPKRILGGVNTRLNRPVAVQLDPGHDLLYVADAGSNSLLVFAQASSIAGGVAPVRTLTGSDTKITSISAFWLDTDNDRLWVADPQAGALLVFNNASGLNGNVPPNRIVQGSNTRLVAPQALLFINKQLLVACTSSIVRFDNADSIQGNLAPTATISGSTTLLSRPQQMLLRPDKDELYVVDAGAAAVLVFDQPGQANGAPSPRRKIQGSQTGFSDPVGLVLDLTKSE